MHRLSNLLMLGFALFTCACSTHAAPPPVVELDRASLQRSLASIRAEDSLIEFSYDEHASLDLDIQRTELEADMRVTDFTYASPRGGRVPARFILPEGEGPYPAILFLHGSAGNIELMTPEAKRFVNLGAAALLIDSPHIRPGGYVPDGTMGSTWPYFTERDRADQIQLIVDLQRAVDFLVARPEIDPARLAYVGISYGGAMGGLLAGVEARLSAYALVVGDGGLVEHTSEPRADGWPDHFSSPWADLMWPIEPLHFVGRANPAALLFQNGLYDQAVSARDALRYQAAASEPKTVTWYAGGHEISGWNSVWHDRAVWLQPFLSARLTWFAPDYRASVLWIDRICTAWFALAVLSSAYLAIVLGRRPNLTRGERLTWISGSWFYGPISILLFRLSYGFWPNEEAPLSGATNARDTLRQAVLIASALGWGFGLGTTLDNLLGIQNNVLILAVSYFSPLLVLWLAARTWRTDLRLRLPVVILTTNVLWAAMVPLGSWLAGELGMVSDVEPKLWWVLTLGAWLGLGLSLLLTAWLRRRSQVLEPNMQPERQIQAAASYLAPSRMAGWILISYLLIPVSIFAVIFIAAG